MNRRTVSKFLLSGFASGALISRDVVAQTPMTSPSPAHTIQRLHVDGEVYAVSPDGTMVAGVVDRETVAVWDTVSFEMIAQSGPVPELRILDDASITWSPQGDAVAWSLDSARRMLDSDIYVFDISTETVANLTAEPGSEEDAIPLLDLGDKVVNVDMFPSWSANGDEVFFARTPLAADWSPSTHLMRVSREGGEAAEIAVLSPTNLFLVNGTMTVFNDGSVLYATWPPTVDDPDHGIFLVTPDGEVEGVSTGILASTTPWLQIANVALDARKASAVSLQNHARADRSAAIWVELDLNTGIPTAFEEVLSLPASEDEDGHTLVAAPAFLTDSAGELTGYLYATHRTGDDGFSIWRHDLASDVATLIGTTDDREIASSRSLQIPHIEVTASGHAVLFFMGSAWTIDLG